MCHSRASHGPIRLIADRSVQPHRKVTSYGHSATGTYCSASVKGPGTTSRSHLTLAKTEFSYLMPRSHVTYRCSWAHRTLGIVRVPYWFRKFASGHLPMTYGLGNIRMISPVGTVRAHANPTRACKYP